MYAFYIWAALIASAPAAVDRDPFTPEILVHAKCVQVEYPDHKRWQFATFRIDHVYCGDAKLKGTTFEKAFILNNLPQQNVLDSMLAPPMREGEEGIWYLMPREHGDGYFVHVLNDGVHYDNGPVGRHLAIPVPARKIVGGQDFFRSRNGNHIHYTSALRWARVVEKVYKASRDDRLKMLRDYARSDNPYVAAWSLFVLADYKPKGLIPFLEKLSGDFTISVAAQVTIDDLMCHINWKKWNGSKQRAALLQHWVSGDIIETQDVLMIAARIENAFRTCLEDEFPKHEMDWKTWLPLMDKWVSANHLSPLLEFQLYIMYQRVRHPAGHDDDFIFSYSIDILKTSKDLGRQRFAAKWLDWLRLTEKQLAIVKDLKEKTSNLRIRSLLDEAVKKSLPKP